MRVGDLKVGAEVVRSNGRTATLVRVEVVPKAEEFRINGVWMTWSDGLGPYIADPDWELVTVGETVDRYVEAANTEPPSR